MAGDVAGGGTIEKTGRDVLHLPPGEGRSYALGRMSAVFKADEGETGSRYSVSEWWLEPGCDGPGAQGVASILAGEDWIEAPAGTFLRIPATIVHDFANRSDARVGLFNVFLPGGFERNMPAIVEWFAANPQH